MLCMFKTREDHFVLSRALCVTASRFYVTPGSEPAAPLEKLEEKIPNSISVIKQLQLAEDTEVGISKKDNQDVSSEIRDKPAKPAALAQIEVATAKPALLSKSYHLSSYANQSETLANLVKLGVDLSKIEKDKEAAEYILKSDFNKDIQPFITFLTDHGVPENELNNVITKNPRLFKESLENLAVRVAYFESKQFAGDMITHIMVRSPAVLSLSTKQVDTQLGFLQKEFRLTGIEVRQVVTRVPKLITWHKNKLQETKTLIAEFLGFTEPELKEILLSQAKVYLTGRHALITRFDYLHNQMCLTHAQILNWPDVFRTRLVIIRPRHLFLVHVGRAQYDPMKENFVPLKQLVSGRDSEFSMNVAKVPVKQYNDFLKTL